MATDKARDGGRWIIALALAAAVCGGVLRLDGLGRIGLKGSDNTYYTTMAWLWSQGERVYSVGGGPALYHRPVVFAVYGLAVRLLGYDDSSIKLVNASLDTANILLVFLLAWVLSRGDPWSASSAAAIYALLPFAILISRTELTHVLSTTTVLIGTTLVAMAWLTESRSRGLVLGLLGGVATGLSALTHEEMIFAAVAPMLVLLLRPAHDAASFRSRVLGAAGLAGSYLLGVLAVTHVMLLTHQTDAQARATVIIGHRVGEGHYLRFVARPLKFAWNALSGSSSTVFACLVIALLAAIAVRWLLRLARGGIAWRRVAPAIEDLPLWTVAGYMVVYASFFAYYSARLFVPMVALVVVWWAVRSSSFAARHVPYRASRLAVAALTAAAIAAGFGHLGMLRESMSSYSQHWSPPSFAADLKPVAGWSILHNERTEPGWPRKRFDELGAAVGEDSRLLVGASSIHPMPGRRVLQVGYYFGDNAVYLLDHEEPIDQLIDDQRIGFVLFTSYQVEDWQRIRGLHGRRYLGDGRWSPVVRMVPGASLGLAEGEYDLREEFLRLRAAMARRGARIILGKRDLLTRRPTGTNPMSYVVWVLDPTRWPPLERELEATSASLELASGGQVRKALATLDGASSRDMHSMARFRLALTGARILAEAGRFGQAAQRVTGAMARLPRNTIVSTALREAYPTRAAVDEMGELAVRLQAAQPKNRAVRDLVLALTLTRTELALEAGDRDAVVEGFHAIARELGTPGSKKMARAVRNWCAGWARDLVRQGRPDEARAAETAAGGRGAVHGRPDGPAGEP